MCAEACRWGRHTGLSGPREAAECPSCVQWEATGAFRQVDDAIGDTCSYRPMHAPDRALSLPPTCSLLPGLPSTSPPQRHTPSLPTRQGSGKPGAGCQQKCQTFIPPACWFCGAGSSAPSRSDLCSPHICTGVHVPRAHACRILTLPCTRQVAPGSGNLTEFSQQPCRGRDQPHVTAGERSRGGSER